MPDAIRYTIMNRSGHNGTGASTSPLRQTREKAAVRNRGVGVGGGLPHPSPLRKRTNSAPGRIGNTRKRCLLAEDRHRVDPDDEKLPPGVPIDDDWERDLHDFFNLVSLVPVVVLNAINWNWDVLLDPRSGKTMQQAWTGEWFTPFYAISTGYFLADLLWVCAAPGCVKSPGIIVQHHLATLLYLVLPYRFPEDRWLMGACLSVEFNTWLLIARRVFDRQGFGPWVVGFPFFSVRIKLISVLFYVTWLYIRCYIYPIILRLLLTLWFVQWKETGAIFNSQYLMALVLHFPLCVLNFKWTFDLFRGKWKALRSGKVAKADRGL